MWAPVASRNPRLLVALAGLRFVLFPIPVITLFWTDRIGMSIADIMLVQAIFGLSAVVLEFPSGYVADRVGHRTALVVGAALWVLGWVLYSLATSFTAVVVAEVVLGAGLAFGSGADGALLYESLAASARTGEYARWEGRGRAAGQASEAASSVFGGYLYALAPRLPFWLQVPPALAGLGAVLAMREARDRPVVAHRSHLARAWHVVRFALGHARVRTAMGLSVTLGLSSFVMVWLIQPYMRRRGIPEAWFGPLWAAAHLWLAGVSMTSARVAARLGRERTLLACCLLVPAAYGLLATSASPWAVGYYLLLMTLRGLQGPLLASVLQEDAPGEDRASVLSLNAMLFRLAFAVGGPPIGMLVDRAGLEAALLLLAPALGAPAFAALLAFRRAHCAAGAS
jgi:predicted MFS family arabinose efflux permease